MRRAVVLLASLVLAHSPSLAAQTLTQSQEPQADPQPRPDPWMEAHSQLHPKAEEKPVHMFHQALRLTLGTGVMLAPLLTQADVTVDGHATGSSVVTGAGGGMGLAAQAEWWPLETSWLGMGAQANGIAGLLPGMHGSALGGGARARLGPDAWLALLGEAGGTWRTAAIDTQSADTVRKHDVSAQLTGSAQGSAARLGVGVRLCLRTLASDRRFCDLPIEMMMYRDTLANDVTARSFSGRLRLRDAFEIGVEVAPAYPVLGTPDGGRGPMVLAHLGVGIDRLAAW